jgi:hypothetical protein
MSERKWMDSVLLPRRQRKDFNDEYDSIASKVVKDWLVDNNYTAYSFSKIWLALVGLVSLDDSVDDFLGEQLGDMVQYKEALLRFSKAIGIQFRDYRHLGIAPDFVVKKDHEVFFVDAIVIQAKPKKYSAASCRIAEEYGFKTMALKLDVRIKAGEIGLTEL